MTKQLDEDDLVVELSYHGVQASTSVEALTLCRDQFLASRDGHRADLYKALVVAYVVAIYYSGNLEQWQSASAQIIVSPPDRKRGAKASREFKFRYVVEYIMNARSAPARDRARKYARALEYYADHSVPPDQLANRLTNDEGIEGAYRLATKRSISETPKAPTRVTAQEGEEDAPESAEEEQRKLAEEVDDRASATAENDDDMASTDLEDDPIADAADDRRHFADLSKVLVIEANSTIMETILGDDESNWWRLTVKRSGVVGNWTRLRAKKVTASEPPPK